MKLIIGLGNPGIKYSKTRHNIGFILIDQLKEEWGLDNFSENKKFHGRITQWIVQWEKIILLKPSTYMNLSGTSVGSVASYYDIDTADILVIHDEIDFPTAKIALKIGGSHAWHNGLRDIISHLNTKEFRRLRIGVDRPTTKEMVVEYVLWSLTPDQKNAIQNKRNSFLDFCHAFIHNNHDEKFAK